MKKVIVLLGCLFLINFCFAQNGLSLQTVKDIKGKTKKASDYVATEGLTIFVFWKTCCPNNLAMLEYLQEAIEEADSADVPLTYVLVSVDDARNASRVRPIVGSYGWKGSVILDGNQEFARRMNIMIPPQWLVVNSKGEEVFRCKITSSHTDVGAYLEQIKQLKQN